MVKSDSDAPHKKVAGMGQSTKMGFMKGAYNKVVVFHEIWYVESPWRYRPSSAGSEGRVSLEQRPSDRYNRTWPDSFWARHVIISLIFQLIANHIITQEDIIT